jgi:hypothetical protein
MGVISKVSRGLGVAGAGLALLMMAAPAQAAVTDSVAAVVTGAVAVSNNPCVGSNPLPPAIPTRAGTVGVFSDVAIAGAWLAGTSPFVGTVGVTDVAACVSAVGNPPAAVPGLVNQGSLGSATYNSTTNIVGNLTNGTLIGGGRFIQAGLVALATINTTYTVSGTASGTVPLLAVIAVVPVGSILGPPNADQVAGPVVGPFPVSF